MVDANSELDYVCIEPDDRFFEFLTANIAVMRRSRPALRIQSVKSLVGRNINNVALEGTGGTKHAVVGSGTQQSRSLDAICDDLAIAKVRLLKSDVDGFDYDILDSAEAITAAQQPLLFFECQCDFDYQKAGYTRTIERLQASGYTHWTIFDNFGEVLLRTQDTGVIFQLLEYTWQQQQKTSTRTIYYYDILAHAERDKALVDRMLSTY
jgi:FkbM family methyltransferase